MRSRVESFDVLRSLLMLLGIPFHASLIYSMREWSVSAPSSSELFSFLGGVINSFRMPAFFLIAGFLSFGAIRKRGAESWLRRRVIRLGIPLLSGMLLLNPFQMLASAIDDASYQSSWDAIWPSLAADLTSFGSHWVRHLWFLPALLVISALFSVLWESRERFRPILPLIDRAVRGSRWRFLLFASLGLVVYSVCTGFIRMLLSDYTDEVFGPAFFNGLRYFPLFFLGAFAAGRLDESIYFGRPSIVLTLLAASGVLGFALIWESSSVLAYVLQPLTGLFLAFAVFPYAYSFWERPIPIARFLSKSSYCIYLAHQPLVALLGVVAVASAMSPLAGFVFVCLGTLLGAVVFYMVVERSSALYLMFNGELRQTLPILRGKVTSA